MFESIWNYVSIYFNELFKIMGFYEPTLIQNFLHST